MKLLDETEKNMTELQTNVEVTLTFKYSKYYSLKYDLYITLVFGTADNTSMVEVVLQTDPHED
jgi:hypothetical protein